MKKQIIAITLSSAIAFSSFGVAFAENQKYVITDHGWVTVYSSPSTSGANLGRLQLGEKAVLISKYNSYWYKISFNGQTGYITTSATYTKLVEETTAPTPEQKPTVKVNANVNFRTGPSTDSKIISLAKPGEVLTFVEQTNSSWIKVIRDGVTGWVSSSYVTVVGAQPAPDPDPTPTPPVNPNPTPTPDPTPAPGNSIAARQEKVVQMALSLQNQVKYVNWKNRQEDHAPYATDCSGFTYLAYRLADVGVLLINRAPIPQSTVGQKVEWGQFQKGDLIFTRNSTSGNEVGHVGIYIGDGKMIHNANSSSNVIISNINTSYYKDRFVVARRVIQ
ncbi:C40 family peptidase [Paenibacillus sp. RC67]|uniref:C40 family peptidase n=1 Tax=Paenibacillus sp. RC67 TaxID=3039392 RepID=UPI0024AD1677|nr:C40 family peptidase [Paenibacillus sp. RC67]